MHRVALDAGSDCPNRDGRLGRGGCVYCDVEGSGTGAMKTGLDLREQLEQGLARIARRDPDCGAIAYFQSYSNTYVETARLREVLAVVEPFLGREVGAVSIATRPDTLPAEALKELQRLAEHVPVWVELGLEAADDVILRDINRLHTVDDFLRSVDRVHAAGLMAIGHAILGLPGDGREGARRTAETLRGSGVSGIKVHHLMVLRRTQLESEWRAGRLQTLDESTYVSWMADFVERLSPQQVLHRITGDAPAEKLLAPDWGRKKNRIRDLLAAELARRGSSQGRPGEVPRPSLQSS